jgi:hypothetical protein
MFNAWVLNFMSSLLASSGRLSPRIPIIIVLEPGPRRGVDEDAKQADRAGIDVDAIDARLDLDAGPRDSRAAGRLSGR